MGEDPMTLRTFPTLKICARGILLAGILGAAPSVWAQTYYEEVINGGACTPPPQAAVIPFVSANQHYLNPFTHLM